MSSFSGLSIKCWECRSDNDPKCTDPFDNTTFHMTDCKQMDALDHLPGVKPTMCRKIRQKGDSSRSIKYKSCLSILLLHPTFCINLYLQFMVNGDIFVVALIWVNPGLEVTNDFV